MLSYMPLAPKKTFPADCASAIITGLLPALQKPGKKIGPPKNLRPLILLSTMNTEKFFQS